MVNYIVLVLIAFIRNGLVETLTEVGNFVDKTRQDNLIQYIIRFH